MKFSVLGVLFVLGFAGKTAPPVHPPFLLDAYGSIPLAFEANEGQADSQVKFLARGPGYTVFLTARETVLVVHNPANERAPTQVITLKLARARAASAIRGVGRHAGEVNLLLGNDPAAWRVGIPTFAKVEVKDIYPGVDVIYYGNQRQLQYDFVVAAGTDPGIIEQQFEGSEGVRIDATGDLLVQTLGGDIRQSKPLVYQDVDGTRRELAARYVLRGARAVGFQVDDYDPAWPVIIDPVLAYSTYLGGTQSDEAVRIAVDAAQNAYVVGHTTSFDFPATPGAFRSTKSQGWDAFITKLDPTGSSLVYSTFLGGLGTEWTGDIAVDAAGSAYVTGWTNSGGTFPQVNPVQACSAEQDAFVTKLNPSGSALVYSTCLRGRRPDEGRGIAVDVAGNAYVTGSTASSGAFSTTPFLTTPGAFQPAFAGGATDGFLAKFSPAGSLLFSTFFGGSSADELEDIALDSFANIYLTGFTGSSDFPVRNALQGKRGLRDAIVAKMNSSGSALLFSTYLGGSGDERGNGVDVDVAGNMYATGRTDSADFPTTAAAFQRSFGGNTDAFVTKINAPGSSLAYSTYLGGSGFENGDTTDFLARRIGGIAVDPSSGEAFVTGATNSTDFPIRDAFQTANGGFFDAFVAQLNATGSALVYSSYLGGNDTDRGAGIAVDDAGAAYVAGETISANFPTTSGAFDVSSGGFNGFVAKVAPASGSSDPPAPSIPTAPSNLAASAASSSRIDLTWRDNSSVEQGFTIERCSPANCTNFAPIGQVPANVTAYSNTGLASNSVYQYRLRAHNSAGSSPYSNVAAAQTQTVAELGSPTNLTAAAISSTQVELRWSDNSGNEAGFRIEGCQGAGCTNFVEIARVAANSTRYVAGSLSPGTTYRCRVRAYNTSGNSGYSNIVGVGTPP